MQIVGPTTRFIAHLLILSSFVVFHSLSYTKHLLCALLLGATLTLPAVSLNTADANNLKPIFCIKILLHA